MAHMCDEYRGISKYSFSSLNWHLRGDHNNDDTNGRFHTLFRRSIHFSNLDKMLSSSYLSSKITPVAKIWAAYTLRGRRYGQKYLWFSLWEKNPIKNPGFTPMHTSDNFSQKMSILIKIREYILVWSFSVFSL